MRMSLLIFLMLCGMRSALAADDVSAHMDHAMHAAPAQQDINLQAPERWQLQAEFELLDHTGMPLSARDFHGRFLLLTFGFTHCEHICPLMAATMGKVIDQLDQPAAGVFISVDTERDNPAITHAYAQLFGAKMQGLGGGFELVNKAAENFGISYVVSKTRDSYTVQHTANIFLLDPAGTLLEIFPLNATVDDILAVIQDHQ